MNPMGEIVLVMIRIIKKYAAFSPPHSHKADLISNNAAY